MRADSPGLTRRSMSLLFIFLLIVVLAWWLLRRDPEPPTEIIPTLKHEQPKSRYRAVRIVPANRGCPAVSAQAGRRFLLSEAPRLPLERCNQIFRCRCGYKHYADRRSGDDRRQIFGSLSKDAMGPANKRSGRDRRRGVPAEYDYLTF